MFLTRREPGVPLSLFRPYPLPFPPPFLLHCSLITLPFLLLCLFHWSISVVVSGKAFYLLFSSIKPYVSDPQGTWSVLVSFPTLSYSLFSSFSSILFLILPFLLCLFHWSISVVVSGKTFYLFILPTVARCFWPAGNLECPCLFSDIILFPFLLLIFYIVPFPSFSSIFFHWSISAVVSGEAFYLFFFAHCSQMFLTRREPGVPLSLFSTLSFSLFSSFSSVLLLSLSFLLWLFRWSISVLVSGEVFYLLFSAL